MAICESILKLADIMFTHWLDWEEFHCHLIQAKLFNLSASKSFICKMKELDCAKYKTSWSCKDLCKENYDMRCSHRTVCNCICRSVAPFTDLFPFFLSLSPSPALCLCLLPSLSPSLPFFISSSLSLPPALSPPPLLSCNIFLSKRALIWPKTAPVS